MPSDRREFLQMTGAGLLAAAFPGWLRGAADARVRPIGLQLYTVRDLMKQDFEGTLRRVGKIGYTEVEFAGYFDRTPAQVRSALKAAHLKAPSSHVALTGVDDDWSRTLDDANAIGCRWVVIPWIDQSQRSLDGYRKTAALFNQAAARAREAGLGFAYHNHDFEFTRVEGVLPIDLLLEETDPELVRFEMDLYWFTKGGGDPVTYFKRWPGRFPLVHVKDMLPGPDQAMTEVGHGKIDWKEIFSHAERAGIEHYFVEHDNPTDPLASIAASYDYLSHLRV